jgi:IS4 transposase
MLYEVMGQHAPGKRDPSDTVEQASSSSEPEAATAGVMGQQLPRKRQYVRKKCKVLSDERIRLTGVNTKEHYPDDLRLVTAEVEVKGKMVVMTFITNNFEWSPYSVCELYQCRWGVEVFFKEIKQTLQLADFLGYNENAVRWQVWTALLAYLLLRFVAWYNKWKHQFSRLFTLLRAVLWNFFSMPSIITCCDTKRERRHIIRGSPERAYQLYFEGLG